VSWNYRVVRDADEHRIIEAYYGHDGNIFGWCEASIPHETHDDLIGALGLMHQAALRSKLTTDRNRVLDVSELPRDDAS
jgi:hypothetical protein